MELEEKMFRQEELEQEMQANSFTRKGITYTLLTVAAVWLLNMVGVFVLDQGQMTIAFVGSALLLLIPVLVSYFVDPGSGWLKYIYLATVCIMTALLTGILSFHVVLVYVLPLLFATQYRDRKVLWITFGMNTFLMVFSMLYSFQCGICDLNILFASEHSKDWYINAATGEAQNLVFNENPIHVILCYGVVPRAIILTLFTRMLQNITDRGRKEEARLATLQWRSEMDLSTGVYNKGKFQDMAEKYYPQIERIAVMFWDVNNLKEINDRLGHPVGDKVILQLAGRLQSNNSERCRVYRLGGDEFLMVLENPVEGEAEQIISKTKTLLEEDRKTQEIPISGAVGLVYGSGAELQKLLKKADEKMYDDKSDMKNWIDTEKKI